MECVWTEWLWVLPRGRLFKANGQRRGLVLATGSTWEPVVSLPTLGTPQWGDLPASIRAQMELYTTLLAQTFCVRLAVSSPLSLLAVLSMGLEKTDGKQVAKSLKGDLTLARGLRRHHLYLTKRVMGPELSPRLRLQFSLLFLCGSARMSGEKTTEQIEQIGIARAHFNGLLPNYYVILSIYDSLSSVPVAEE